MEHPNTSNLIHGHNRVGQRSRTYSCWDGMMQRCTNPKHKKHKDYGAKGITVCDRWLEFNNFLEDMGEKPEGLTLDRKDPKKGYYKENCRWATYEQQNRHLSLSKKNKSGHKGVCLDPKTGLWRAYICLNKKQHELGKFNKLEDAVAARKAAEEFYWGDDARGGLAS
jgi:hypothetical protein